MHTQLKRKTVFKQTKKKEEGLSLSYFIKSRALFSLRGLAYHVHTRATRRPAPSQAR